MGPNIGGLLFGVAALLALGCYLLLSTPLTFWVAWQGAAAGPRLSMGRRLAATAAGWITGCAVIAGAIIVVLPDPAGIAEVLLSLFVALALALLVAYYTSWAAAGHLNRYRCAECRVWFRASSPMCFCPSCAKQRAAAAQGWQTEFAARLRELGSHRPAAE